MLAYVIRTLIEIYSYVILARCIFSFMHMDNAFIRFLHAATEPLLAPIRALLSKVGFISDLPIDLSPVGAFILLGILSSMLK